MQFELINRQIDSLDYYLNKRLQKRLKRKKIYKNEKNSKVQIKLFKSNYELPLITMIGCVKSEFINIDNLKNVEIIKQPLMFNIKSMCEISGKSILFTSFCTQSCIFLTNNIFETIEKITKVGNIWLINPYLVCSDNTKETLYIFDSNNRVIICDIEQNLVKSVFNVENVDLVNEINYYKSQLYVLCSDQKLILVYDSNGIYLKQIKIKAPCKIKSFEINKKGIFALCNNKVYIFDTDGDFKTCLNDTENNLLTDFCLIDDYAFFLKKNGNLTCYEFTNKSLSLQFEKQLNSNCTGLSLFFIQHSIICYFNWSEICDYNPHVFILKTK